jgi:hypothetical protein
MTFFGTQMPWRRLLVEMKIPKVDATEDHILESGSMEGMKEGSSMLKIHTHFIKGKIILSPMDFFFSIPWELEYLENM